MLLVFCLCEKFWSQPRFGTSSWIVPSFFFFFFLVQLWKIEIFKESVHFFHVIHFIAIELFIIVSYNPLYFSFVCCNLFFLISKFVDLILLSFFLFLFFFKFKFLYFNWRLIIYNIVLVLPYINMNFPRVYTCSPSWTPFPPPSPYHPSGSSQCTSPKYPVSCIEPGLAIRFIYDIIHVSMPFSQIIPPSLSPTESKRLIYTSVSLLLSHIQGYRYHLSKFHIYALMYCIGVFLSDLLLSI